MARKNPVFTMYSYGEYSHWDRDSRELPNILNITDIITATIGTEFGYMLKIKGGKGCRISYCIEHPPFRDNEGKITPPFEGEFYINSNEYEFFLGDCIWEPLDDKIGDWRLITYYDGKVIADKTLHLV